jgi:hypothetical protein
MMRAFGSGPPTIEAPRGSGFALSVLDGVAATGLAFVTGFGCAAGVGELGGGAL